MAAEFEVSFQKAYDELVRLKGELKGVGEQLDTISRKGQKPDKALVKHYDTLNRSLNKYVKVLGDMDLESNKAFNKELVAKFESYVSSLGTQLFKTADKTRALANENHALHGAFKQIAENKSHISYLEKAAANSVELSNRVKKLTLDYENLNTKDGQRAILLQNMIALQKKEIADQAKKSRGTQELTAAQAKLNTKFARSEQAVRVLNKYMEEVSQRNYMAARGSKELTNRLQEVQRLAEKGAGATKLSEAIMRVAQISPEAAKGLETLTAGEIKLREEIERTKKAVEDYNAAMQKRHGTKPADTPTAATETATATKATSEYQRLTRAQAEAEAKSGMLKDKIDALNKSMVLNAESARRAQVTTTQLDARFKSITQSLASGNLDKANNQFAKLAVETGNAAKSVRLLSQADANFATRNEVLTKMVELRNRAVSAASSANMKLTSSQKALVTELHRQTMAQEALAASSNLSIRKMLGLGTSYDRVTHSMKLQQQAASALRATLSGLHASIGMYTSATILMATASYAAAAAIRNTVTTAVEFGETMSRVEAIMFSGTNSYEDVASNMKAVEAQIRSLGQSTIFTSNEVAKGMVDLGMAGLNASQAMEGLKPALDLASIGGLDMSRSADIVTNVLTTFKMEASQLTEVVDVMAVAVTNSNTNVEQLANAITYVGPAAQAAGFSLKDTVATIELLSNAGIKASKAGTGLRRFMLNLLNPTEKGQKVIDKYNISLYDMDGQTRELTDIVSQFGKALMDDMVTPAERTAAIVDLVGVRAASAVSRMVSSFDDLELIRYQLESVTGASDDMRRTIEDNLGSDWKKVISAFSEVQKQAFDPFENSLRLLSAEATVYMQQLLMPFDEITSAANGLKDAGDSLEYMIDPLTGGQVTEGVTNATMLAYELRDMAEAALYVGAAFSSVKLAGFISALAGPGKGSLATGAAAVSLKFRALNTNIAATTLALQMNTSMMNLNARAAQLASTSINVMGGSMLALGKMAQWAATGVSMLAAATARVVPFLGWGIAIYSIGSAIAAMLRDSDDHLEEHRTEVEATRQKYIDLQQKIDEVQGNNSKSALQEQLANTNKEIEATKEKIEVLNRVLEKTDEAAPEFRTLSLELRTQTKHLDEMEKAANNARVKISEMGATIPEMQGLSNEFYQLVRKIADVEQQLENGVRGTHQYRGASADTEAQTKHLKNQLDQLRSQLGRVKEEMRESAGIAGQMGRAFIEAGKAARTLAFAQTMDEGRSNYEKIIADRRRLAEIDKQMLEIDKEAQRNPDAKGYEELEKLGKEREEVSKRLGKAEAENLQRYRETKATQDQVVESSKIQNYELEKTNRLLAESERRIANLEADGAQLKLVDEEQLQKEYDLRNELESRRQELMDEAQRKRQEAARQNVRDAKKAAQDMQNRVEKMIKTLFPDREIEIKFKQDMKTLEHMRDLPKSKGGITQEEYDAAVERRRRDYRADKESSNPDSQLSRRLSEDYLDYSTQSMQIENDRARITEQYGSGTDLESIAMREWTKKRRETVLGNDVPDVTSDSLGAGDMDKIEEERKRLEDWKEERLASEQDFFSQRLTQLARQAEDEQMLEEEKNLKKQKIEKDHQERLAIIEAEHAKKKERIDKVSNQVRYKDAAAMFSGMAELSAMMVGDSARLTQGLLAFEQAATIASTIQNMANGQAKSFSELGPIAGAAAAAGLVAQTASLLSTIGSVVSPQEPDTSTSSYSGAYDKGGVIPAGKYGVVGEYGPELVHGPAAVTGRRETAKMYGESQEQSSVTLAPQISVTVQQQGSEQEARKQGDMVSKQVNAAFQQMLQKEMRPNGTLDKWKRGKY